MAFKLTTYDAIIDIKKAGTLVATDSYLKDRSLSLGGVIHQDKLFDIYGSNLNNYNEILICKEDKNYSKLFSAIFKYYKLYPSYTIVIPVEVFRANASTFSDLYKAIYSNMKIFAKKSPVTVLFAIRRYLDFNHTTNENTIYYPDLKNKLPKDDECIYLSSKTMAPSVLLNHVYYNVDEAKAATGSTASYVLSIENLVANLIKNTDESKCFAHVISPDQFKKMRERKEGKPRKVLTKESLYRLALTLGLDFTKFLQIMNIEGYSFSPNDLLDVAIINFYYRSEEIREDLFIEFLKRDSRTTLNEDIINRLEEIKNINGLI